MPKKSFGFTILELLISISILALISLLIIPNFHKFNQSQVLNNDSQNLTSLLRSSQTNAQSNLNCPDGSVSLDWQVTLNRSGATISCQNPPNSTIPVSNCNDLVAPPAPLPAPIADPNRAISYSPNISMDNTTQNIGCVVTFLNNQSCFSQNCMVNSGSLPIILKDSSSNTQKNISVDKGGAISSD